MNKNNFISLIYKKLKGDISLEEHSILDIWVSESKENEALFKQTVEDWELTAHYDESQVDLEIDVAADYKLLQQRIQKDTIAESIVTVPRDKLRVAHQPIGKVVNQRIKPSNNTWVSWAAAAAIVLGIGFWFLSSGEGLTTENVALETQYGEEKVVTLADGTKVWLNQQSKLAYPTTFDGDKRMVQLTGEAYFEVAKNAEKPFIIETNKAKVTVLGTSFNVRARLTETAIEVLVKTGKVRLENTAGDKQLELTPNEKGIYNAADNSMEELQNATMNDLGWHSDVLVYKNAALEEVLADISKQFEVDITLSNPEMKTCNLAGRYDTDKGVKHILETIASSLNMETKVIGNTTYQLIGGKCQEMNDE